MPESNGFLLAWLYHLGEMRKFVFVLAAGRRSSCHTDFTSKRANLTGDAKYHAATQNFTAIRLAACQGWGPCCRPGYVVQYGAGDVGAVPATDLDRAEG
jgi:hypothetical protein